MWQGRGGGTLGDYRDSALKRGTGCLEHATLSQALSGTQRQAPQPSNLLPPCHPSSHVVSFDHARICQCQLQCSDRGSTKSRSMHLHTGQRLAGYSRY